jgi:hypothetical protein
MGVAAVREFWPEGAPWHAARPESLSENSVGVLFSRKRLEGEARRGRIPAAVSDGGATKPTGLFLENPAGGGSFARGRRWLGRHSPLRGCSWQVRRTLAALATAKIPRRRTPRNFQTGSEQTSSGRSRHGLADRGVWHVIIVVERKVKAWSATRPERLPYKRVTETEWEGRKFPRCTSPDGISQTRENKGDCSLPHYRSRLWSGAPHDHPTVTTKSSQRRNEGSKRVLGKTGRHIQQIGQLRAHLDTAPGARPSGRFEARTATAKPLSVRVSVVKRRKRRVPTGLASGAMSRCARQLLLAARQEIRYEAHRLNTLRNSAWRE